MVEASSTTRTVRASRGAVWGSSWARYQARVSVGMPVAAARVRAASPLTAAPMTRQPAAVQASRAAAMVVVLPAPARPMAHWIAVPAGAERAHEVALLVGEVRVPARALVDDRRSGTRAAPRCRPVAVAGDDAVLDGEHLAGGVQRLGAGERRPRGVRRGTRRPVTRAARRRPGAAGVAVAVGDREVGEGGEDVGPGEDRQAGADAVGCGKRREQRLGSGLGQLEGAVEAGGELRRARSRGRRRAPPAVDAARRRGRVVLAGRVLSTIWSSSRRLGAAADGVFELAEGVVDLVAPPGELAQHRVGDAGDLPAALAAGPPADPEAAGELVAHLGGGQRRGGLGVPVEAAGVEGAAAAVGESSTVLAITL